MRSRTPHIAQEFLNLLNGIRRVAIGRPNCLKYVRTTDDAQGKTLPGRPAELGPPTELKSLAG